MYTTVVQDVYNRDHSPELDDVLGLAAAATKHLELLIQKDEAESSFSIEKIVGKLLRTFSTLTTPCKIPMVESFTYTLLTFLKNICKSCTPFCC